MGVIANNYVDADTVGSAAHVYNDIRTTLEGKGWTVIDSGKDPGYWCTHPDHGGTFSMAAAFRKECEPYRGRSPGRRRARGD